MTYRLLSFLTLLAVAVLGQDTVRTEVHSTTRGWFVRAAGGRPVVTGAPYSADEVNENVQTLADGTHITHTSTSKVYRDSAGRTRTERTIGPPGTDGADAPTIIEIDDPVAHVHYTVTTVDKIARKRSLVESQMPPGAAGSVRPFLARRTYATAPAVKTGQSPDPNRPQMTSENLGSDVIEGLTVQGTRRKTTWPAGSFLGNDRPVATVTETWRSPELKVVVLSKTTDPRSGEHTQKLTNISRDEPDDSLFQPPADYTITEENRNGDVAPH